MKSNIKIRKTFHVLIFFAFSLCPCAYAEWSTEDRRQEKEQLDLWEGRLSGDFQTAGFERIEELALGLRSMAFRKGFGERDPRTDRIFAEIQRTLLAIPGHAEYYRERVLEAQRLFKSKVDGPTCGKYRDEQMYAFQTLPHLPSSETVRVLGEMLSNDWAPPGNETAIASEKIPLLSVRSTAALGRLPIRDKPFKHSLTLDNITDAQTMWRQWYEEIKSGKRTFRFEGDPTEYDLNGPAPGQKVDRITRDRKRETERATLRNKPEPASIAASVQNKEVTPKALPIAVIISGLVLFGSLVWYFARDKSRRKL